MPIEFIDKVDVPKFRSYVPKPVCGLCQIEFRYPHTLRRHLKGIAHKNHKRLIRLLSTNCISQVEIAKISILISA
jgi:hypothetical protein